MRRLLAFAVPLLLAGCGTLPQPFLGHPGNEGARLAVPPPPVLIIPPPTNALLGNRAAKLYATDLAQALVERDVPSLARPTSKFDWKLETTANILSGQIVPQFVVAGPTGHIYGHATGAAVPVSAWASGDPSVLKSSASAIAPELAKQLAAINASVQQSNPLSLENRPPRIFFKGVRGAPGDGDHALALGITRDLNKLGIVLVNQPRDSDFIINGIVKISKNHHAQLAKPSDLVELDWIVRGQNGHFIGKVSQLHDLRPSQMSPYWGDVAAAAAAQASLGLKQVIANAIPKQTKAQSPSAAVHPAHAKSTPPPAP